MLVLRKEAGARRLKGFSRVAQAGHMGGGVESVSPTARAHTLLFRASLLSGWPGPRTHRSAELLVHMAASWTFPRPTESPRGATAQEYSWLVSPIGLSYPPKSAAHGSGPCASHLHGAQMSRPSPLSLLRVGWDGLCG